MRRAVIIGWLVACLLFSVNIYAQAGPSVSILPREITTAGAHPLIIDATFAAGISSVLGVSAFFVLPGGPRPWRIERLERRRPLEAASTFSKRSE